MKKETSPFQIRNVKPKVRQAISKYCLNEGMTQASFLEKDKRLKPYL